MAATGALRPAPRPQPCAAAAISPPPPSHRGRCPGPCPPGRQGLVAGAAALRGRASRQTFPSGERRGAPRAGSRGRGGAAR